MAYLTPRYGDWTADLFDYGADTAVDSGAASQVASTTETSDDSGIDWSKVITAAGGAATGVIGALTHTTPTTAPVVSTKTPSPATMKGGNTTVILLGVGILALVLFMKK